MNKIIYCPLLNKNISEGYCFDLCNIASDDILLGNDKVKDWDRAQEACKICGRYEA
ncbi:MAG: hypothetical protein SPE00_00440 [Bacilli bacterium]|nr:hypothetical protein [Bacilli bacterium]